MSELSHVFTYKTQFHIIFRNKKDKMSICLAHMQYIQAWPQWGTAAGLARLRQWRVSLSKIGEWVVAHPALRNVLHNFTISCEHYSCDIFNVTWIQLFTNNTHAHTLLLTFNFSLSQLHHFMIWFTLSVRCTAVTPCLCLPAQDCVVSLQRNTKLC